MTIGGKGGEMNGWSGPVGERGGSILLIPSFAVSKKLNGRSDMPVSK